MYVPYTLLLFIEKKGIFMRSPRVLFSSCHCHARATGSSYNRSRRWRVRTTQRSLTTAGGLRCKFARTCAGQTSYKMMNGDTNKKIADKARELQAIVDCFDIQVDNPIAILNQEESKRLIKSKDPKELCVACLLFPEGAVRCLFAFRAHPARIFRNVWHVFLRAYPAPRNSLIVPAFLLSTSLAVLIVTSTGLGGGGPAPHGPIFSCWPRCFLCGCFVRFVCCICLQVCCGCTRVVSYGQVLVHMLLVTGGLWIRLI
jgi:hypothetical protein